MCHFLRICLFVFVSIFSAFDSIAESTYSFAGKIDRFPIYLSVSFDGNDISGTYFYKNQLVNIDLTGKMKEKTLYLSNDFDLNEDESKIEVFKLNWNTKNCSGTWTKNKKVLKVTLSSIPLSELNNTKLMNNPYLINNNFSDLNKVKIGLFRLTKLDSVIQVNGRNLSFFRETHTEIDLFRVDDGYAPTDLKVINQFLESQHIAHFLGFLDCKSYSNYEVYYEFSYQDISFNKDWFNYATVGSYFCGGAHPDEYMESINFHIPSKKSLSMEEIILDIGIEDETFNNSTFNKIVVSYFKRTNPAYFNEEVLPEDGSKENIDDECEYYRPELYALPISGVATKDGFLLFPHFEHFRGFCNWPEWCIVPYEELSGLIPEKYQSITRW